MQPSTINELFYCFTFTFCQRPHLSAELPGCAFFYYFTIKVLDYQIETFNQKLLFFYDLFFYANFGKIYNLHSPGRKMDNIAGHCHMDLALVAGILRRQERVTGKGSKSLAGDF